MTCLRSKMLLAVFFLLPACGDDGGGGTTDTMDPATGDGDGDGDGDAMSCVTDLESLEVASNAVPEYTCDEKPSANNADSANACRNTADCALIASDQVRHLAKNCALTCRDQTECDAAAACNGDCLANDTMNSLGGTLTDACSACYEQVALCMLEKCYAECAASADAPACVECSFKQGCRLPFERCSGLDRKS
jgi:hypothetical protein